MGRSVMARRFAICGVLALAGVLTLQALAAPARSQPDILGSEQVEGFVTVEEVALQGERVSGVIVNRRSRPLRDVRLLISHVYLWPSEVRPGQESPNEAETIVVEEEIPVGGRKAFSTTFPRPSPPEPGGDFVTNVYIAGFTEVVPPQTPSVRSPEGKR
jgi:hypothetical protein